MSARMMIAFCTVAAYLVLASPAGREAMAAEKMRPNVIFVEVDDLLYKHLGCFGSTVVKTPHLDALASRGVMFRNAACQGMMCGPSRNTLITGTYPHNWGFYRNGQMRGSLPEGVWSFPAAMQRAGYYTAWIGKSHVRPYAPPGARGAADSIEAMKKSMGFDHCFLSLGRGMLKKRRARGRDAYADYLMDEGVYEQFLAEKGPTKLGEKHYMDSFFTGLAIELIETHTYAKPLFLWLNFSCPHGPHDAPKKYHGMYAPTDFADPIPGPGPDMPKSFFRDTVPAGSRERIMAKRAAFAANISYVDSQVGRLVERLQRAGRLESTVIVFFSDHGEMDGDHGFRGKGVLYENSVNPSLIISWPGSFRQGHVEKQPVELLDATQMALELAGAAPEDRARGYGVSLVPLLTGRGTFGRAAAFCEIAGYHAAISERYKYIYNRDDPAMPILFDLKNDPNEMKNVALQNPDVVRRMHALVYEWGQKTKPFYPIKKEGPAFEIPPDIPLMVAASRTR